MKNYFMLLICAFLGKIAFAQQPVLADENFKFDQRVFKCEKKWVIFPKAPNAKNYPFGYIYVDRMAGFTLNLEGFFYLDQNKNYVLDTAAYGNKAKIVKYRLEGNSKPVALITADHYSQLKITAEPDWVKIYYQPVTDSLYYNFRRGFIFNGVGEGDTALTYLKKVYKMQPHYKGLEFEMAYAYNVSNKFADAIKLLEPAIKNDPGNIMFYREMGYAYLGQSNLAKAIEYYKQGVDHCNEQQLSEKSEMAINMARAYKLSGDDAAYKEWGAKAKQWAPLNSAIYKNIEALGF